MPNKILFNYNEELLEKLKNSKFVKQDEVGDNPLSWAREMKLPATSAYLLPNTPLTRQGVRTICQNESPLKGYLCAMAWGAQGRGPGGAKIVKKAWEQRAEIEKKLQDILNGDLTRSEAYELFTGDNSIDGLGPAYFTKLLYFFTPAKPANCYIMDQWTTKPVLLLTEQHIIRHSNGSPTRDNTGDNYELFCLVIENLTKKLNMTSPEEMEERLFSIGSILRQPRGEWRAIIHEQWQAKSKFPRYNKSEIVKLLISDTD